MTQPAKFNVLLMASEADPLIKVGGLGDVAGSLPRALNAAGKIPGMPGSEVEVRLVIPHHPAINKNLHPSQPLTQFFIHSTKGELRVKVEALELDGTQVYLIGGAPFEQEPGVYSSNLEADGYKYVFFSVAALRLAQELNWKLDVLHANDWHTAAAVYALALNGPADPFFRDTASLLTVHNLPYLGAMSGYGLAAFDLPPAVSTSLPAWASHMALPLGLLTADAIVAVSPGYAAEIMTAEFGSGLHTFLKAHRSKVHGILNGLDTQRWDPQADQALKSNYSAGTLANRAVNKSAIQLEMALEDEPGTPLVAMVTRMDPQKGVDLAIEALGMLLRTGSIPVQAVFLGTGNPLIEEAARHLQAAFPEQVRAMITYDEQLSRRIYAGADVLLMPSRYEPCGLSQMIAMRYGCVPVAHSTGGLADTIFDPAETEVGSGYLFTPATATALAEAIQRALAVFTADPQAWKNIQLCGMAQDFSWDRSADEYLKLYGRLLQGRKYV